MEMEILGLISLLHLRLNQTNFQHTLNIILNYSASNFFKYDTRKDLEMCLKTWLKLTQYLKCFKIRVSFIPSETM